MAYTVRGTRKKGYHIGIPTEAMAQEKLEAFDCEIIISKGTTIRTTQDNTLIYTPVRT
jgi:hypothetical protein